MRVAPLAWESLHPIPVGGVEAHVTELAAALQRKGHEVHVFTRMGA
jgi:glycogen synthase